MRKIHFWTKMNFIPINILVDMRPECVDMVPVLMYMVR